MQSVPAEVSEAKEATGAEDVARRLVYAYGSGWRGVWQRARQIPTDRVGLGSRVTVEDQRTSARETYYLVFGDAVEFDEGHVTMASPIGRSLLGKAVGEVAHLKLPGRVRQLKIVELRTIHDVDTEEELAQEQI